MTLLEKINNSIDLISEKKISENNPIKIELPTETTLFIKCMADYHANLRPALMNSILENTFFWLTNKDEEIIGLNVEATLFNRVRKGNSWEENINPDFITTLKKIIHDYLKDLASNWKECSSKHIEVLKIGRDNEVKKSLDENCNLKVYRNTRFEFRKLPKCNLILKLASQGLSEKIQLYFDPEFIDDFGHYYYQKGSYIIGEEEDLKFFLRALRETMEAPSLKQTVCKYISEHPLLENKDKVIPEELATKIREEKKYCLKIES